MWEATPKMQAAEQQDGAARPEAHDAPHAVPAHVTIDTAAAHAAKAAAIAPPPPDRSLPQRSSMLCWRLA